MEQKAYCPGDAHWSRTIRLRKPVQPQKELRLYTSPFSPFCVPPQSYSCSTALLQSDADTRPLIMRIHELKHRDSAIKARRLGNDLLLFVCLAGKRTITAPPR